MNDIKVMKSFPVSAGYFSANVENDTRILSLVKVSFVGLQLRLKGLGFQVAGF